MVHECCFHGPTVNGQMGTLSAEELEAPWDAGQTVVFLSPPQTSFACF